MGIALYIPEFVDDPPRKGMAQKLPKSLSPDQELAYVRCARDQLERELAGCKERRKRKQPPCPSKIRAAQRDLFLAQFLLGVGLRSDEMIRLRVDQIDTFAQSVFVENGKGSKQRYVPLPDVLVPIVRAFVGTRTGLVLVTERGWQFPAMSLYWRVRRLGKLAGIPFIVHPHTLRHTMAVRIYEVTRDLNVVKELLGHESIATTQIYAHCAPSIRLEAVNLRYRMALDGDDKPA